MTRPTLHLALGPPEHGVVRCARELAAATANPVISDIEQVPLDAPIHVHFTDRLFGRTATEAADAFVDFARRHRAPVTVTVHDVPQPSDGHAFEVRTDCYRRVIDCAAAVVVSSMHERLLLDDVVDLQHDVRVIPLPIGRAVPSIEDRVTPRRVVGVLGFVYPGKGHEEVLGAMTSLDSDVDFLSIGSASPGHESMIGELACTADQLDRSFVSTGFVPDDELDEVLRSVAVPVAFHRHVSASGSINSWIAAGRRPLVPRGRYVEEMETNSPGALWIHENSVEGLAAAMAEALRHPDRTWQQDDVVTYPTLGQAAALYRALFDEQRAKTADRLPDGRWVVPGNRWDLAETVDLDPRVSVVIPYFRQQRQLELVLGALTLQSYPARRLQVIVADDGSPEAPTVDGFRSALDITVVRQPDLGFRAAAARNLGASVAEGEILCFLDADTVPEPGYIAESVRLLASLPDALTVGRRRHADLTGRSAEDVAGWFRGESAAPPELTEPQWLRDGYRRSRHLLDADRRSYRYIISAVMSCSRELFSEIGGFDETFVGYGGEDWDFAHRAYDAGAVLAHLPHAVAWHDGPEWAERTGGDRERKNLEALMLSSRITDPAARTHGLVYAVPEIVVVVDSTGHSSASLLVTVGSVLHERNCAVWIAGPDAAQLRQRWGDIDPRVHLGRPGDTCRSHIVVHVRGFVLFGEQALRRMLAIEADRLTIDVGGIGSVELRSSRSNARAARWAGALGREHQDVAESLFGHMHRTGLEFGISPGEQQPNLAW
ncbi:glycosyltransferase [Rhodococcus sp. ARC_M5]|uniref:glycosyltransferase n=1 Tax=Rhodococcus sp. ARC_M5 TaxID=2928851 RepID=UPI001FB4F418|nr:glycosyltransferase [Rhodococcus sp. ARC_M5]MCJ0890895.1 glycosyltransferase [Rhodococcus sp. ARC_M5]